jgi:hypothetical protein
MTGMTPEKARVTAGAALGRLAVVGEGAHVGDWLGVLAEYRTAVLACS